MLCELAQNFPRRIAELLERDRGLTRNFREETVTDLLMASLVGLQSFGVRVDFPDEPTTGGDLDWIYAAPLEINGGRYLRLILQAKRAQFQKLKNGGYWFYRHLDHGSPLGKQAQTLTSYATTSLGGKGTLPLFIFYHPTSALEPAAGLKPAVEGVNIVFASKIAPIVNGGCNRRKKKVDYWRDDFLPLSDLLCWPAVVTGQPPSSGVIRLVVGADIEFFPTVGGFHPDLVARRFRERREQVSVLAASAVDPPTAPAIEPADGIPDEVRRAIEGEVSAEDRRHLKRPRVILSTSITREGPEYPSAERVTRLRQG